MPSSPGLDDRTPVIVGVGQINQRVDDGAASLEPAELMANALRLAADDCGVSDIVAGADSVRAVHVLGWRYRDPARLVAERLGCPTASTHYTHVGGNVPQLVVNGACRDLAEGRAEVILVTGAETGRSKSMNRRAGTKPNWTVQSDDVEPDVWTNADASLLLESEIGRGVAMPVQIYPLFESAWRAANGWTVAEDRQHIARLMARFSEVAAANPHAWRRQAYSPEQIDAPDDGNRFIGFPYRKLVNSNENVEQGAGLILTTVGRARSSGVPEDRWIFPLSGTEGSDAPYVSNRVSFAGSGAIRIAGTRALALAGTHAEALDHVDLYSCFPVAVQIAAHELGLTTDRDLTVTGSLPFAGGPWSNYVTHSIATIVERLRATGGTGLVFANGGYLTKHAFGVYATEPARDGYAWEHPQDEIDALGTVEVCDDYAGPATVESCTVMHNRDDVPELAIITARLEDGRRAWGKSRDTDVMTLIETEEVVGRTTTIDAEGTFTL